MKSFNYIFFFLPLTQMDRQSSVALFSPLVLLLDNPHICRLWYFLLKIWNIQWKYSVKCCFFSLKMCKQLPEACLSPLCLYCAASCWLLKIYIFCHNSTLSHTVSSCFLPACNQKGTSSINKSFRSHISHCDVTAGHLLIITLKAFCMGFIRPRILPEAVGTPRRPAGAPGGISFGLLA